MIRYGAKFVNIWIDDRIHHLQRNGGISRLWRVITPLLQAHMPDCTFDANQRPDVWLSTYYAPAPQGVASVVVAYDFIAERYSAIGAQHVDAVQKRRAIAEADAVVAISQWTANDCAQFCHKPATVAYCATDLQRTAAAAVEQFKATYGIDRPYVLLVGRRGLYKNARALYQAWPLWNAHTSAMVVAIGGEAPTVDDLAFAQQYPWLRIEPTDSELAAAYSGAQALVYPSLYEGFGLPVLEALACGCPVVCGNGGSLPEVAGDAAMIVNPLLPLEITKGLEVATNPGNRVPLALRGYEQVKRFSWATMAATLADTIRSIA